MKYSLCSALILIYKYVYFHKENQKKAVQIKIDKQIYGRGKPIEPVIKKVEKNNNFDNDFFEISEKSVTSNRSPSYVLILMIFGIDRVEIFTEAEGS